MSLNEIVKTMQDAVNRQTDQAKPGGYDTTATVRRIEGDTAFVHIPGGVDETPVKLTINAKAGDNVQVRVSGGNAFLVGNGSAPPTDDARANQAYTVATVAEGAAENALANAARAAEAADSAQASATRAEGAANDAVIAAGDALTAAGNAQTAADSALVNLATVEDVVGVLNWITEHGTMTLTSDVTVNPAHVYFIIDPAGDYVIGGTHYSIVSDPKDADLSTYYELTVDESVENYVATHIVVDSEGLWIIPDAGGNKVLIATGSGSTYTTAGTYIVGKVGGVDTVLASFAASGVVIGDAAGAHTSIDEDGMQIYSVDSLDNVVNLANIGYGQGTDHDGNTSYAPYYTLGRRIPGSVTGNYSVAEGYFSRADGYASHAEGTASVDSNSFCGHAEGSTTFVLASCGHAEGLSTTVRGDYAHAQNNGTYADRRSHTVVGEYNIRDQAGANGTARGDYAVIVGNGTDDSTRSNALTVDWSGNVEAAGDVTATGDVTDGSGNVLANKDTSAWAYMYISSKQLNNTESKITGLTLRGGGNYTDYFDINTANQIKIKKAGVYHVEIYMRFTSVTNAANVKRISVFKNGASNVGCLGRPNSYEDVTTWDLQTYAANDVLTMYGRSEDGNATASYPRIFIKPLF